MKWYKKTNEAKLVSTRADPRQRDTWMEARCYQVAGTVSARDMLPKEEKDYLNKYISTFAHALSSHRRSCLITFHYGIWCCHRKDDICMRTDNREDTSVDHRVRKHEIRSCQQTHTKHTHTYLRQGSLSSTPPRSWAGTEVNTIVIFHSPFWTCNQPTTIPNRTLQLTRILAPDRHTYIHTHTRTYEVIPYRMKMNHICTTERFRAIYDTLIPKWWIMAPQVQNSQKYTSSHCLIHIHGKTGATRPPNTALPPRSPSQFTIINTCLFSLHRTRTARARTYISDYEFEFAGGWIESSRKSKHAK